MQLTIYPIFNDVHFPYEDRVRYQVALNILKDLKPNISHIFLNGDIGEFLGVSTHAIHPTDRGIGLCGEIDYLNKKFDELDELFPDAKKTYICGNHEYRFFRYVRDMAPAMWGLLDCPSLLKFPERPLWRFVDYSPEQLVQCGKSSLYLRHEPLGGGQSPAKLTAEKSVVDIAFGHTHIYQVHQHRKFGPSPYLVKSYSLGWLGDRSRHVFDYRGSKDNWVSGFSIVECDVETGHYNLEFIDLRHLPVLYRGKYYNALT